MALHGSGGGSVAFRGALVKKSADQTAANLTAGVFVAWDAEDYDTDNIHSTVTNNSRLIVPTGVTKVRVGGQLYIQNSTVNTIKNIQIFKNGSWSYNGAAGTIISANQATVCLQTWTPILTVTAADYFELGFTEGSDTSEDIIAAQSWFAMEIIK